MAHHSGRDATCPWTSSARRTASSLSNADSLARHGDRFLDRLFPVLDCICTVDQSGMGPYPAAVRPSNPSQQALATFCRTMARGDAGGGCLSRNSALTASSVVSAITDIHIIGDNLELCSVLRG